MNTEQVGQMTVLYHSLGTLGMFLCCAMLIVDVLLFIRLELWQVIEYLLRMRKRKDMGRD